MTFALPMWGNFAAMVSIYAQDGTVAVTHVGIEMGQGINTKVSLVGIDGSNVITVKLVYTITLCTLSALTCSLRYVKPLTGYGGSSSNHTVFTICLLIYLLLSEVQRLNLFS
jgi:hypothetical protein